MTPARLLEHAVASGYDRLAITDHVWDSAVAGASAWYAPQDIAHVQKALPLPAHPDIKYLFGCETEYCGADKLGLRRDHFDLFDIVVIPVNHTHMIGFVRPPEITTEAQMAALIPERLEQLLALDLPWQKIGIAHLSAKIMFREGDVGRVLALMDSARMSRIFDRFAALGAGIELNAGTFLEWAQNPDVWLKLYRLAKRAGCRFYCASDAHRVEALDSVGTVLPAVVEALGLTEADRFIPA